MDDAVFKILKTLVLVICLPTLADPLDLSYVTPAEVDRLQDKFAGAHASAEDVRTLTETKGWRCDLFGVRTRLQIRRDVDLYRFSAVVPTPTFKNSGAQPIASYGIKDDALRGDGEKGLRDEVRLTKEHELIAKLSLPERGVTVAYALCRGS